MRMHPFLSCRLLSCFAGIFFTLLMYACGTDSEETQVLEAAQQYAKTVSDVQINLQVEAVENNFARVRALPADPGAADEALMYLRKERGTWQGIILGAGFSPEDYQRLGIPENIR